MEYHLSQSLSEGVEYDVRVGLREKLGVKMGGDNITPFARFDALDRRQNSQVKG